MTSSEGSEGTGERAALLARVADLIPEADRPLLVVVDGVDGAGKTWFADELAEQLASRDRSVVRASADGFHHPREHRHRLGRTPESVWTRHFDYRAMRRELLDPWLRGAGAPYRTAVHDVATDEYVDSEALAVPERGVLVVDGVFAQRPELENAWDLVVFLDVPFDVSVSRLARRDGTVDDVADPDQRRYLDAQRIYFETCGPREKADLVVDNSRLDLPAVVAPSAAEDPPAGWAYDADALVRTIRLPREASATAALISRLADEA